MGCPNHQFMSDHVAERFAASLDAADYQGVKAMLSEDCKYTCRGRVYRGRVAIIESYRLAGDSAARSFDSVTYDSAVTSVSESVALVHFTDHLCHNGRHFTFECEQSIVVGRDGLIARIEHADLAGQREALAQFMNDVGVGGDNDG